LGEAQAFDFSVKASLDNLQEVRSFIDRASASLGVGESVLGDLRLAVDEAVTNVVLHGYGNAGGDVELHVRADGDDVVISILDRAARFDPGEVKAPRLDTPLHDRPAGGMGIFLIRQTTDLAEFLPRPGGGNELRLRKRRAIVPRN
jgi:anti-sigma regulatory factor (Ser/Thr protein kinase)